MRLDRYISQATGLSRTVVRQRLRRGEICVDGELEKAADRRLTPASRVTLAGEALVLPGLRYFMLNKPAGVVCSTADPAHPTVIGLLGLPQRDRVHPVGRLDRDATGLVLLTDDGAWSHRITSPRRRCAKVYRVHLAEPLAADAAAHFARGVQLKSEKRPCLPAELEILGNHEARVTLHEGRYHQVKRMFAALGNRVISLHREAIGGLWLDPALPPGAWRALSLEEANALGGLSPSKIEGVLDGAERPIN